MSRTKTDTHQNTLDEREKLLNDSSTELFGYARGYNTSITPTYEFSKQFVESIEKYIVDEFDGPYLGFFKKAFVTKFRIAVTKRPNYHRLNKVKRVRVERNPIKRPIKMACRE